MEVIKRKPQLSKLPVLVVVLLVAGLVGGYFIFNKISSDSKQSLPAGWAEYKNEKYSIKFNYRLDWGTPKIIETSGDKGKSYAIVLAEPKLKSTGIEKSKSLSIRVESKDYTKKVCAVDEPTSCGSINALTSSTLKSRLENKTGLIAYDETSYSTIASQAGINNTKVLELTIAKIVDIDKMNADALQLTYTIYGAPSSCTETFQSDTDKNCLSKEQYTNLQNMLISLKNI